jgi:hypothetical protein
MHQMTFISDRHASLPRFAWNWNHSVLSIDGNPIIIEDFKHKVTSVLNKAEEGLKKVLCGLSFPELEADLDRCLNRDDPANWIRDNINNRTEGYSFITDTRNPFFRYKDQLLKAFMSPENRDTIGNRLFTVDVNDVPKWNTGMFALRFY